MKDNFARFMSLDSMDRTENNNNTIKFINKTLFPNLFNPDDEKIITGGYYATSGKWIASEGQNSSALIPCTSEDKFYRCQPSGTTGWSKTNITFWNKDGEYVSGFSASGESFTVPQNSDIMYFRFPFNSKFVTAVGNFLYGVVSDSPVNDFVPYSATIDSKRISVLEKRLNAVENSQWKGKVWYAYGTSLTNTDNEGIFAKYVEQFSGMTRVNKGISGGGIVVNTKVKSAVMNTTDGKLNADLITLETGANDNSAPLGTIYDTGDDTYCGALNQCIRYLQENTNAQIVVISSTNSRYSYTNPDDLYVPERTFGTDQHTKYDQWKAIREVCAVNSVAYIPMGEASGMGYKRMISSDKYNIDQIHNTELGGYNLALFVWSHLKNIPCWYSEIPTE